MYPKSFKKLIDHFASLPSVGPKMAERLVLYLVKQETDLLHDFAESIGDLKTNLRHCKQCGNLTEDELCYVCTDRSRDTEVLCVVEDALDVIAIEKTKKYNGLYHVLGGVLSPAKNATTQNLKLSELERRVKENGYQEIVIATNPTTEGDATALYIQRMLKSYEARITRLARGLSTGGDIEYADEITLGAAITNRK